jgi:hypothetical protein
MTDMVVVIGGFLTLVLWIVLFISGIYTFVYGIKLDSYLKKNRPERWREITTLWGVIGMNNPCRFFPYLLGDLDEDDEYIAEYKSKLRSNLKFSFTILLVAVLLMLFLILIMKW